MRAGLLGSRFTVVLLSRDFSIARQLDGGIAPAREGIHRFWMNAAIESVLQTLSPAERILLVEEIWDRIATEPENVPVSPAQRAELDRRLADLERNPDAGRPWAEIRDELRRH